jgi:hypothetical protein
MKKITKYQEKTFKDYLQSIEDLNRDLGTATIEEDKLFGYSKSLRFIRIHFFEWFKKQIK